ncbi:unnamed protein product [Zymoseptoria tritici ST99CH_1A5]|uniref:Uncharacterized protein n=1 Tax=Zymoseptoria tritici ST99CH_1A5 TaxID=1276529 RepID=A0A1Y6LWQ5_ZYMTR|nr:unnamed protein product [Zymoseptoria tritici ST99CH_1A5]
MSRALSSDLVNWNKLDHDGKASTQAKDFTTILADMLKISFASFTTQSPWLMGTTLHISLPQLDFETLKTKISKAADCCYEIITHWHDEDEDAVYVRMCIEVWQTARNDGHKGCRTQSWADSLPADSPNRLQLVRVSSDSHATTHRAYNIRRKSATYPGDQVLAYFLQMSGKFSSVDMETFFEVFWMDSDGSFDSGKIIAQAPTSGCRSMLTAACSVVEHAFTERYMSRLEETKTPDGLDSLDTEHKQRLSFVDRSFCNQRGVAVHLPGVPAARALEKRRPSFFVGWSEDSPFGPQVHILDDKVVNNRYCMLISSSREPTREECEAMIKELEEELGVPTTGKSWVTQPFKKGDDPWFRADGVLEKRFKEEVINEAVRKLDAERRVCEARPEGLLSKGPSTDLDFKGAFNPEAPNGPRRACTIVVYTRTSKEDGSKTRITIPKQTTTTLGSPFLRFRRRGDRVWVFKEMCSSNKHAWKERCMTAKIPRDRPIIMLSSNPDRVTRRPDEVLMIVEFVKETGGAWYTQGFPIHDGDTDETWTLVDGDAIEILMERLRIDRQRAFQAGTPNRGDSTATRLNNVMSRSTEELPQISALHAVLLHYIISHGFTNILLVARNCPTNLKVEKCSGNGSQNRQLQFLRNMLPPSWREAHPDSIFEWKAMGASAFTGALVSGLQKHLSRIGGKVLILTVRPDQMLKSVVQHSRLHDILSQGRHHAMSFIWDHKTFLEVSDALQLDLEQGKDPTVAAWADILVSQIRAAVDSQMLPILQPVDWISGSEKSETAIRHVKNADECSQSIKLSSYQGGDYVDPHFLQQGPRGFNDESRRISTDYIKELFRGEGIDAEIIFPPKDYHSFDCWCEDGPDQHDPECQCTCSHCVRQRSCPCEVWVGCECPPLCNCHCVGCHDKVLTEDEKRKMIAKREQSKKRKREQADDGQTVPAGGP